MVPEGMILGARMLLRRITKHVKDQNWFAVAIDFVIVVIGVFIGIQVANWNDARSQRALESAYVERLHQEVEDIEAVRGGIVSARTNARLALSSAFNKLKNPDGVSLNGLECFLIAFNPPVTSPTDDLPLIVELLSSGRLTFFQIRSLRKRWESF